MQNRIEATGTFELVVRHLPPHRNFLVAAGLEQALECLEQMRFAEKEVVIATCPSFATIRSSLRTMVLRYLVMPLIYPFQIDAGLRDY